MCVCVYWREDLEGDCFGQSINAWLNISKFDVDVQFILELCCASFQIDNTKQTIDLMDLIKKNKN